MLVMPAIVGSRADSARRAGQWQAVPMNALVLIVLIVALVLIIAAAVMTIAVSLSSSTRD
jgi:flagellar basal body-associated protein FliL